MGKSCGHGDFGPVFPIGGDRYSFIAAYIKKNLPAAGFIPELYGGALFFCGNYQVQGSDRSLCDHVRRVYPGKSVWRGLAGNALAMIRRGKNDRSASAGFGCESAGLG